MTEERLKEQLKGDLAPVYFLYGEEAHLVGLYAGRIAKKALGGDALGDFNLHRFDGQECEWDLIEEAAEALPLMAERTCVVVRDLDVAKMGDFERMMEWLKTPSPTCTLVFYTDAVTVDAKRNAKWRQFTAAVEKVGGAVEFRHKTTAELARLLCAGAAKQGCTLRTDTARMWVEQAGDDLALLLNELDKLTALADGGEITPEMIETASVRQLEAKVYDLSKAIVGQRYDRAYDVLHKLYAMREDPITVLAVLSGDYANLYRAKLAGQAGVRAETLAEDFGCKGREFRLQNAARDCRRMSRECLRQSLEELATADTKMKSTAVDNWILLEEVTAKLILLARTDV
ncbi:MAG: DNA polymerase III subunit delta [Acutalibacteraceae bacterium]|jgi:DNA polymerase-3 subunit delta